MLRVRLVVLGAREVQAVRVVRVEQELMEQLDQRELRELQDQRDRQAVRVELEGQAEQEGQAVQEELDPQEQLVLAVQTGQMVPQDPQAVRGVLAVLVEQGERVAQVALELRVQLDLQGVQAEQGVLEGLAGLVEQELTGRQDLREQLDLLVQVLLVLREQRVPREEQEEREEQVVLAGLEVLAEWVRLVRLV